MFVLSVDCLRIRMMGHEATKLPHLIYFVGTEASLCSAERHDTFNFCLFMCPLELHSICPLELHFIFIYL